MKFIGYVPKSYDWSHVEIMWLVSCQGHVIDRFRDYDIIMIYYIIELIQEWVSRIKSLRNK